MIRHGRAEAGAVRAALCAAALACGLLRPAPAGEESKMTETAPRRANRLLHATSPYLLQHAHNPIDWYEWGEEAFAKAVAEDKPIFLSIGYAACHWCHVMAHETFEDPAVADFVNERFVCIKVDREERPDVDEIYMHVTQVLNRGSGGWPMSVFLMPDRRPIYAGTYFPRDAFLQLCTNIDRLWNTDRAKVLEQGTQLQSTLDEWAAGGPPDASLIDLETVDRAAALLSRYIDPATGGFRSDGNKFPPSMALELMLRVHRRTGDPTLLESVVVTLDHMARGGIYDHLGGGICRYSTDPDWLVPHFEKMLYDQALVSSIYLDAYQVTRNPHYAQVAREIFDYVIADLQGPAGGFYSTRDADSEGLEGAYYVWTVAQVTDVLGEDDGELFCRFYDVSAAGNWHDPRGHAPPGPNNILHVTKTPEVFAKLHGLDLNDFQKRLAAWREQMLAVRAKRVPPGLDDKVLTGWNGLMIASLAKGARVLDEPKYAAAAAKAADFVLTHLRQDGRLLRSHRAGRSHLAAYLSDYAFLIDGLLNLYEATFTRRWLTEADALNEVVIAHYRDEKNGGFFFTADDAEKLIARTKSPRDGAIPSGNSVQASNLLRLALLLDRQRDRALAEGVFRAFKSTVESSPGQCERLLCAVDLYHDRPREVAIVGTPGADDIERLIQSVYKLYLPNKVVVAAAPASADMDLPLLVGKTAIQGRATAYVCENRVCRQPVTDPAALLAQLQAK